MSGLLASLPPPTRRAAAADGGDAPTAAAAAPPPPPRPAAREPPPYGARAGFVPRTAEDFGGGGAFPEVHVAQFPLDMGRPGGAGAGAGGAAAQTLALTVGADGGVAYDAVVRRGRNADKWIATDHSALVPKLERLSAPNPRPDADEEARVAAETAAALAARVARRTAAANPSALPAAPGAATYIKYTPAQAPPAGSGAPASRIIKMQDMPVDPLEPPKFRHKKVPRGAGSPPVPVMHSPPRALGAADQADWKIPPCVSNWKNAKGYTIPLDKRLAADGRGLAEATINEGFAAFTEALYVAEQKARAAVEARARMQRELVAREKEAKEAELRDLAARARLERVGGGYGGGGAAGGAAAAAGAAGGYGAGSGANTVPVAARGGGGGEGSPGRSGSDDDAPPRAHRLREGAGGAPPPDESAAERAERRRRDDIREERRAERERERRLEAQAAHGFKRSKLTRDRDRDVSERVALGQAALPRGGEAMYDQRLFNQDAGGGADALAADDAYNLYDKPLFTDRGELNRASRLGRGGDGAGGGEGGGAGAGPDTARFKPDRGFAGADYSGRGGGEGGAGGGGGVAFEREGGGDEADPFGLDAFLSDVRAGKKARAGALDAAGGGARGGSMAAAGGGGGSYEDLAAGGSGRSKLNFQRGGA